MKQVTALSAFRATGMVIGGPAFRATGMVIGGPKCIVLLQIGRQSILLYGTSHHRNAANMSVIHMIQQLMNKSPHTEILVESFKVDNVRDLKSDKPSNQIRRTAHLYARHWGVDLKNINATFNRGVFRAAAENLEDDPDDSIMKTRKLFTEYIRHVYHGHEGQALALLDTLFSDIPNASKYTMNCIRCFRSIRAKLQGVVCDLSPLFTVFQEKGYLELGKGVSNTLNVQNSYGCRAVAVSLLNDLYATGITMSSQNNIIFYGGSTHVTHMVFLLHHCYNAKPRVLLEVEADIYATEVLLTKSNYDFILSHFS